MSTAAPKKRVVILGGGFAGAYTALHLEKRLGKRQDVEVFLVAKENFLLFTPMLHEVAGSDVEATDIIQPLRRMLRRTWVGVAEVEAIDLAKQQVRITHSDVPHPVVLTYDHLVLALGAVTNFYHTPGLDAHALSMKTLGDAILVRNRVIDALELADNQPDERARRTTLTVVVAGGGFAGAETVGAVNDFLRDGMRFYRHLKEDMLRVVLVHPGEVVLPELGESLGRYAQTKLARRGVEILLKTKVTSYDGREVALDNGAKIATRMLIWTAGTTPPALLAGLPCALQRGRVVADDCLRVPNWPGVWALGDCALVPDPLKPGTFYPPTAQHAIRQAAVLADNIVAVLRGESPQPFKFKIIGLLASIGRRAGVAEILGMQFSGYIAWWLWRGIYLSKLPGLQKKVRVAIDWTLDLLFSKDIVQLPTVRARTMSEPEEGPVGTVGVDKMAELDSPQKGKGLMKTEVLADAGAVARAAATLIAAESRAAVGARERFSLAVSGGQTPWQMLQLLTREDVPWEGVHVFQVDERVAPDGHPDRNLTHLRESLLQHAPLRPEQIHAMPVESLDLDTAATQYAVALQKICGGPPVLDLVHLGLGPDGHTASLVPGDPVLDVTDRDAALTGVYQGRRRMTLTYPALNRARRVLWLVTGAEKADMLLRLRARDESIPAGRVRPDQALALADQAAAGQPTAEYKRGG